MPSYIKVLRRNGVDVEYNPDDPLQPQDGDWVELIDGSTSIKYTWRTPVEIEDVAPPAIRRITKRAFLQRFTLGERTTLRSIMSDPAADGHMMVVDIYEDLQFSSSVDLDLTEVAGALAYFTTLDVPIIESSRVSEILIDGTEAEAYRGV